MCRAGRRHRRVCGGDSGGPVFDEQGQGLIAIVSASRGCGEDQVAVLAPLTGSSDLQGA
ncbi:trypsin-like serine protease [Cellulomonas sp.]|uniref:trypsin-like serine protease n=1 Tax=Cellulomonas sp. TaxID=40001 RepID=UPI00338E0FF9